MKKLKWFNIICFVISVMTVVGLNLDNDGSKGPASIAWGLIAAANIASYTKIILEESRQQKK
jgi:hypothetical protein